MSDSEAGTARHLAFDRIASAEDTGAPVIEARLEDTGSWLIFIPDDADGSIRVQHVMSHHRGDMATILDEVVAQLGETTLRFMNPLDDLKTDGSARLKDRLHGFEHETETFEDGDETVRADCYVGEWDSEQTSVGAGGDSR